MQQQQQKGPSNNPDNYNSEDYTTTTSTTTTKFYATKTSSKLRTPATGSNGDSPETDWLAMLTLALVAVAFLFHLIAMGSPYWATTSSKFFPNRRAEHIGLWKYCVDPVVAVGDGSLDVTRGGSSNQICNDFVDIIYSDWLKAAQSFMILSFFAFLPTLACVSVVLFVQQFKHHIIANALAVVGMFICGFFQFITVIIFGIYYPTYFDNKDKAWYGESGAHLSWTYVIACFSFVACLLCAGVLTLRVMEVKRGRRIKWDNFLTNSPETSKLLI